MYVLIDYIILYYLITSIKNNYYFDIDWDFQPIFL